MFRHFGNVFFSQKRFSFFKGIPQLPCAKALYNYEGKEPGDLKFSKGDIIILRRQVDENWYHGEVSGVHGFFPTNFVQIIKPLPQPPPQCKALYDFEVKDKEADKDCLPFAKVTLEWDCFPFASWPSVPGPVARWLGFNFANKVPSCYVDYIAVLLTIPGSRVPQNGILCLGCSVGKVILVHALESIVFVFRAYI